MLTVEDTIQLKFNGRVFDLRTNRLIELYQHLKQHTSERKGSGCSGDYTIADTDYINLRRESRDVLEAPEDPEDIYVPYEEVPTSSTDYEKSLDEDLYGYVIHSPRVSPVSSPMLGSRSSPKPGSSPKSGSSPKLRSSPMPSRKLPSMDHGGRSRPSTTILPSLIPPVPSYGKPEPPPKPKNAGEILNEFKDSDEPLYTSVQRKPKHSISASSIGIGGLSVDAEDEEPPIPLSPQYLDFYQISKSESHIEKHSSLPNPGTSRKNYKPNIIQPNESEEILYESVYDINSQANSRRSSAELLEDGSVVPTRKPIRVNALKMNKMQKLDRMLKLRAKTLKS